MNDLEKAREIINSVDAQMAELFEKRMEAVMLVSAYKQHQGLPVEDISREEEMIAKNETLLSNKAFSPFYVDFLRAVIDVSKKMQYTLRGE